MLHPVVGTNPHTAALPRQNYRTNPIFGGIAPSAQQNQRPGRNDVTKCNTKTPFSMLHPLAGTTRTSPHEPRPIAERTQFLGNLPDARQNHPARRHDVTKCNTKTRFPRCILHLPPNPPPQSPQNTERTQFLRVSPRITRTAPALGSTAPTSDPKTPPPHATCSPWSPPRRSTLPAPQSPDTPTAAR